MPDSHYLQSLFTEDPQQPISYGLPKDELEADILVLKTEGKSLAEVYDAIDTLPDITDKKAAKDLAQKLFS